MQVGIVRAGAAVHIKPEGEMTIYHAADLKAQMLPAIRSAAEVEIDLSGVSEMDTAGFQLLVMVKRELAERGQSLRLIGHSPATLEVLDWYQMAGYFGDPVVLTS
jgi:anti-anti-sigma factor